MSKVVVMDHPLIEQKIGIIRQKGDRYQGLQTEHQRDRNADRL